MGTSCTLRASVTVVRHASVTLTLTLAAWPARVSQPLFGSLTTSPKSSSSPLLPTVKGRRLRTTRCRVETMKRGDAASLEDALITRLEAELGVPVRGRARGPRAEDLELHCD